MTVTMKYAAPKLTRIERNTIALKIIKQWWDPRGYTTREMDLRPVEAWRVRISSHRWF